jgi:hypothetical protein
MPIPSAFQRTFAVLVLAVLTLVAAAQQPPAAFRPGSLYQPPLQRAVKIVVADGVLLVDGSLSNTDGSVTQNGWFVLDTAATATILNTAGLHHPSAPAASGKPATLENQTLVLAGARVSHRTVLEYPLNSWSRNAGQPIAGIAGADLLQHFDARIDYMHRFLALTVPQSCAIPGEHVALRMVGGLPFLEAQIQLADGKMLRGLFLLDTGQAGPGLVLTSEFLAAHPEIAPSLPPVEVPLPSPENSIRTTRMLRLPALQLGRYTLRGVIATVAPPNAHGAGAQLAGVIGGGVLAHFDVLLDLPHASVTLTPNGQFDAPFEADMSGMLVLADQQSGEPTYTIAGISKNSPAADAGLRAGDLLLDLNGKKVTDMSLDLVRNVLKSGPGAKVVLTIDRSGKRTTVTLKLRRAL